MRPAPAQRDFTRVALAIIVAALVLLIWYGMG